MQPVRTTGRPATRSASMRRTSAPTASGSAGDGRAFLRGSTQAGRSGSLRTRSSSAAKRRTRTGSRASAAVASATASGRLDHQELLILHLLEERQDILVDRL